MNLSKEQLDFLKKELNLDRSNVERMNVDQWHEVRMKCFDIETEEAGMVVDDRGVISERGEMAAYFVDYIFNEIMPNLKKSKAS